MKLRFFEIRYLKNIQKVNMPNGQINGMLHTDKIWLYMLYNPYLPDEEWTDRYFKIIPENSEYQDLGSHQVIGAFEKDKVKYLLIEKMNWS